MDWRKIAQIDEITVEVCGTTIRTSTEFDERGFPDDPQYWTVGELEELLAVARAETQCETCQGGPVCYCTDTAHPGSDEPVVCTERGHARCERVKRAGEWWTVHHPVTPEPAVPESAPAVPTTDQAGTTGAGDHTNCIQEES